MFETLAAAPPDAILGITDAFNRDSNSKKINLSVGVYQDENGKTPVLKVVKDAERKLLESEVTKTYLGIDGLPAYRDAVSSLLFGEAVAADRVALAQTPGGTAGVRVAADLVALAAPGATVWHSNPTWANHPSIFQAAGLQVQTYPYLDASRTGLDFAAMTDTLSREAKPGDCVLLHACCHNPTGIDPTVEQWQEIVSVLKAKHLLPIVDFAYQGFGTGLEEDASGLRMILEAVPEVLVASSFSKNFGLYSERVGAVAVVASDAAQAGIALSQLKRIVRTNYSNPPRHGAAIVATVLSDPQLTSDWHLELAAMRGRIAQMRQAFVDGMRERVPSVDFSFLLEQKGMFSFSGLNPLQVDRLKNEFGIYIVGSGRINVAGITPSNLDLLCDAIATVVKS